MASLKMGFVSSRLVEVFFLLIFLPSCRRYTLTKGSDNDSKRITSQPCLIVLSASYRCANIPTVSGAFNKLLIKEQSGTVLHTQLALQMMTLFQRETFIMNKSFRVPSACLLMNKSTSWGSGRKMLID